MPEWVTPSQLDEAEGLDDWRILSTTVATHFRTTSFSASAELVDAIGALVDDDDPHTEVDVRPSGVTVQLRAEMEQGFRSDDAALARAISGAARSLGAEPDPSRVQDVQLTIDAAVSDAVMPFWRAVLGYRQVGDADLVDPQNRGPAIWFQRMRDARTQRNRIHVDVWVPPDEAEGRIVAAIEAGGRVIRDADAPAAWTLADAEGNEVDIATWKGRD